LGARSRNILAGVVPLNSPRCTFQTGGTNNSTGTDSKEDEPVKVFKDFIKAVKDEDFKAMWDLMSQESKDGFKEQGQPSYEKFEKEIKDKLGNKKIT